MSNTLTIKSGQYSIAGAKAENQDSYGVLTPQATLLESKGIVAVIADGVSSSSAGKEASEACVKGFLSDYYSTPDSWSVKKSCQKVLSALNSWLYGIGVRNPDPTHAMVSTLSALVFKSTRTHVFHVGDSRIYRLRDGQLEPLTRDHHAQMRGDRRYLSRAMGVDLHLDIDYSSRSLKENDYYVFTTDGVHEYLKDREIHNFIEQHSDNLDMAAQRIVDAAAANDSPDNLTCQIVYIETLPEQAADEVFRELTALPFPPPLESGMKLDGYQIIEELHASTTSELYLAEDMETRMKVVIKTPSDNYNDDPAYIERFLHESWVGRRVQSPHVVKLIECARERHFLYTVMELIKGKTLREWMDTHPKPELPVVLNIIKQIESGLRALHRLDMIHQDLKPENVLIDNTGVVKIIDFGSVRIAGIAETASPVERINMLGTKNYMAPEYLSGKSGAVRSDLFSLGVIAYEMLTGKLPYEERLGRDINPRKLLKIKYQSSLHFNPMIPIWMDGALEKATKIEPDRRYGEISEFIYDLEHPNPSYMSKEIAPLIERNPLLFWKVTAQLLFVVNLVLLYLLLR